MSPSITYATLSAQDEQLHQQYEQGLTAAQMRLGQDHPCYIGEEEVWTDERFEERSPIDRDILIGRYSQADEGMVDRAVQIATKGAEFWRQRSWTERVDLIRQAADLMEARLFELAALLTFEVGKPRLEALGDVAETFVFFRYYADQMEKHNGFVTEMGRHHDNETNRSVLLPYGVWGIISPFNFPMALTGGPTSAALLAGNSVILKPSNQGALAAIELYRILRQAGVPPDTFQVLTGGDETGAALVTHHDVDGITFTGSYEVGMGINRSFSGSFPKPVVCEMGGKNPAIVTERADLELAAEGVARAAFGFSGQKCSACSRVLVSEKVAEEFRSRLIEWAKKLEFGDPRESDVFSGPVIDQDAVVRYQQAVSEALSVGGAVWVGGKQLETGELGKGNFVAPTVLSVPDDSWVWNRELFVPIVAVRSVADLEEALDIANDTDFGLTAGIYSESSEEIERFFDRIAAGVVYANRRAGATTGAWPNIQSFGGWKGSGSTGVGGGGPWYLRQFMREQSRTVIDE